MIEFQVKSSPQNELLGNFQYKKNQLIFGGSKKDDFIIPHNELSASYLTLKLEDTLLIASSSLDSFYFVNGKKISGNKKIKPGDEIQIGDTLLKIIAFSLTTYEESKKVLAEAFLRIKNEFPEVDQVLSIIESEINDLEKKSKLQDF